MSIKERLINSFDTQKGGFSGRKLTAFYSIIVATYLTYLIPVNERIYALAFWQLLALLCLGIVTFEQIIKLKNGDNNKHNDTNE
jgi:hypothetical protein